MVTFNTPEADIEKVIDSYAPSAHRLLFIIDNSEEPTCRYNDIPYITYIFTGNNMGYGAAHNIGIYFSIVYEARYHCIVNPDISFHSQIIDRMVEYANQSEEVVYMMPKIVYPNGHTQYLCKLLPTPFNSIARRFLPNIGFIRKENERYILKNFGYDRIINPPCLSGCFMFLRVSTLKKEGLRFDDRFFMYYEDFDLIRRLHRVGKTIFYPEVTAVHTHARLSYRQFKMMKEQIKSAFRYFNKYGWFFDIERREMNTRILEELRILSSND